MRLGKEWESFRITLLLYIIVIVIPLTFYFIHNSFNSLKEDTEVIHQIGWINGILETDSTNKLNSLDKRLEKVSIWVNLNNNSEFYLGSQTLKKDFLNIKSSLNEYKQKISQDYSQSITDSHRIEWNNSLKNLTVNIKNMVYLKEHKLINLFYLSLSIVMILSLILIYMVRNYIAAQINKHAIYDFKTKLFNKKYFSTQLKTACASAARREQPLSIMSVFIPHLEKENSTYSKNDKNDILRVFGALLESTARDSDVACRYKDGLFLIMLPYTTKANAVFLEERLYKSIEAYDFKILPRLEFIFKIESYKDKEIPEEFIKRLL